MAIFTSVCQADAAIYRYVGKDGVIGFTDDKDNVPSEYSKTITVILSDPASASAVVNRNKSAVSETDQSVPAQKPASRDGNDHADFMSGIFGAVSAVIGAKGIGVRLVAAAVIIVVLIMGVGKLADMFGSRRAGSIIILALSCLVIFTLLGAYMKSTALMFKSMADTIFAAKGQMEEKLGHQERMIKEYDKVGQDANPGRPAAEGGYNRDDRP